MRKRLGLGLLILCLAFSLALRQARAQNEAKTKSDRAKSADVIVEGELVTLDVPNLRAILKTEEGPKTVQMAKAIAVVGPRGGKLEHGLKDKELNPGAIVRLTTPPGGRLARELKVLAAKQPTGTKPLSAELREYSYTASAKVTAGGRILSAEFSDHVRATNQKEAVRLAREEVMAGISEEYPGWKVVDDSLKIEVNEVAVLPATSASLTRLRLTLACQHVFTKEGETQLTIPGLPPILKADDELIDSFTVRVWVKTDGKEEKLGGDIRTLGRGNPGEGYLYFTPWQGELLAGETLRSIEVRVEQKNPVGDDFKEVGAFRVVLRNVDDKLQVDWQSIDHAKVVGPSRAGPLYSTRFKLDGNGSTYSAVVHVDNEGEVRAEFARKDAELKKKLAAVPPNVKVMSGAAEAEIEGPGGQRRKIGVGRTFVIADKEEPARAVIKKTLPSVRNVVYAKDELTAKSELNQLFQQSFASENVIAGTLKITLVPKKGWAVGDSLNEFYEKNPPANPK